MIRLVGAYRTFTQPAQGLQVEVSGQAAVDMDQRRAALRQVEDQRGNGRIQSDPIGKLWHFSSALPILAETQGVT